MKHRHAPIGFTYLFGLICASFLSAAYCLTAAGALLAAAVILLLLKKRGLTVMSVTLCAAFLIFGLYSFIVIEPQRALALSGEGRLVTGTVLEREEPDNDTVRLVISGEAEGVPVRLAMYTADFGARVGDRVTFPAAFYTLRDSADFSQTQYYFSKGIYIGATAAEIPVITGKDGLSSLIALPGAFSEYLRGRVSAVLPGEEGGLLCAMFFGDKSGLSPYMSGLIKRAGLSHMTAVSGMHISIIINIAALFFGLLPKRRVYLCFTLTAALIVLIMLFFGMSASVMRSGAMLLIYYAAEPLRRKTSVIYTLGFALMAITLFRPFACRDIGLWMSALGTIGVAVVAPAICGRLRQGRFAKLRDLLIASACAALCVLPVSAVCFGGVSLISPVSSVAVYPLFFAAFTLVLITAVTGGLFAEIMLLPAGIAARGMITMIKALGSVPYGYIRLDDDIYRYLTAVTAVGLLFTMLMTRRIKHSVMLLMLAVCAFITAAAVKRFANSDRITVSVYSDGSDALVFVESGAGISAFASSDSRRICSELFSRTAGGRLLLLCAQSDKDNNQKELLLSSPEAFIAPYSPDSRCDIGGEYAVSLENGVITLEIRGVSISLLKTGNKANADIAVFSGYKKNREASGAGAEIFCDKRCRGEELISAYYENIEIIINAGGETLLRREGGAAA